MRISDWSSDVCSSDLVLFQLRDRKERGLALGPTHEEVVTRLFKDHAQSYRDLPVTLFQLQTKFRDEARPRGRLVRVRESTKTDKRRDGKDCVRTCQSRRTPIH